MCDGTRTQEQIVDDLAKKTKIEKTQINNVVFGMLAKLEQAGLIQKV